DCPRIDRPRARLAARPVARAAAQLPLRAELLGLRDRGVAGARRGARWPPRAPAHPALPAVGRQRLRPGSPRKDLRV
ncbi:MAG: Membrane protein insertion efficiency factor YidD, partial [uncultured Sphingomonadaceae bacterium]